MTSKRQIVQTFHEITSWFFGLEELVSSVHFYCRWVQCLGTKTGGGGYPLNWHWSYSVPKFYTLSSSTWPVQCIFYLECYHWRKKSAFKRLILRACCVIEPFYLCLQDVDLKVCQGALDDCCPPPGQDQLELQEEEKDIYQVSDETKGKKGKLKRKWGRIQNLSLG